MGKQNMSTFLLALSSISCWRTLRLRPQHPKAQLLPHLCFCPPRSVTDACSRPLGLQQRSHPVRARQPRRLSRSPSPGCCRIAPRAQHPVLPQPLAGASPGPAEGRRVLISVDLPQCSQNTSDYDPTEPPRSRDPYLWQQQQSPSPKQINILNLSLQDGIGV